MKVGNFIYYNIKELVAIRLISIRNWNYLHTLERREARKILGYFVWKITILCQKILFFQILGGGGGGAPNARPLDPPT